MEWRDFVTFKINDEKTCRESVMGKLGIIGEYFEFMRERKKWWLLPVIVVLLLLGTLIVLTESSSLAPFIYTLF